MKKTFILVAMAFLLMGAVAVAEEAIIIDFALLNADIIADPNGKMTQNRRTVMDYGKVAGASYTDEQKALMRTSLALEQWDVELNSSAQNPLSVATSTIKEAEVRAEGEKFAGQKLMGVRILFPEWTNNANAKIKPGFLIPAYEKMAQVDDQGNLQEPTAEDKASGKSRFEDGYGVVKNVGALKSVAVTTMGMNYPEGLYVMLKDTDGVERRYFMGYLNFDGWKTITWSNPQYISEIRNREIRIYPIYPRGLPFVKFTGFQITRDANHVGGDYIGYFKDVKIIYDKALLTTDRDIADEDLWGIIGKKEAAHQAAEMEKFGNKQVNRYLEREKQAKEDMFTSSLNEGSASNAQTTGAEAN